MAGDGPHGGPYEDGPRARASPEGHRMSVKAYAVKAAKGKKEINIPSLRRVRGLREK